MITIRRLRAKAWRVLRRTHKESVRRCLPLFRKADARGYQLERLGSDYGGWRVPVDAVTSDWVCYCVGVGVDATFDLEIAERFGSDVHAFDPTPRAIDYADRLDAPANFHFHPVGIWSEDTELTFFAPADSRETSHSVFDLHGTGGGFQARCLTLKSMMQECGHDRVDLLKLDVEGAWREVLGHVLDQPTLPIVMGIEFDSPTSLPLVIKWIDRLQEKGLSLAHVEKENFVFIDFDRLEARRAQAREAAA